MHTKFTTFKSITVYENHRMKMIFLKIHWTNQIITHDKFKKQDTMAIATFYHWFLSGPWILSLIYVILYIYYCISAGAQPRLQSWGVQFLGLGYYYPSTEKNRQVYPVWCSRLHNHTLFIKKLSKTWGSVQILGVQTSPTPQWLRPWFSVANKINNNFL